LGVKKYLRALLASVALLLGASLAHGQLPLWPAPPPGGLAIGGITITRKRPIHHLSFYSPGFYAPGYYDPFLPYARFRSTSITIINVTQPPPLLIVPPLLPDFDDFPPPRAELRGRIPAEPAAPPDRPAERPPVPNPFRQPPDQPRAPAPQPPVQPAPKPEAPKPERPPPELPPPPQPEPNPRAEYDKQIALGKTAFANGEYGRAAHRFRLAIVAVPEEPMGQFLLAQALLALAKYQEAFEAIEVGLRQQPNWPLSRFRPLELYGDNVGDYPDHLARLEQLVRQQPDDPVLLFLYAYQLWFDGRQDEAIPLFQRAAPMLADKNAVERFLQARPPAPPQITRNVGRLPCCC
jgi:hypothetical protein